MRILIVEEALQTGNGHWPSYIGGLVDAMRRAGDEVEVLMHRDALPELVTSLQGNGYLSRNCWLDPASQGSVGGIRHNLGFRRELSAWLGDHQPYDWVCALTMRLQHLLAFALLSKSRRVPASTRFLLLFVQGFGQYTGHGNPTSFPKTASNHLARLCFRLMAHSVRSGRVVLAAETQGMQDELQRFTGLPVALFPHPVERKAEMERGRRETGDRGRERGDRGQGLENFEDRTSETPPAAIHPTTSDLRPPTSDPVTITCPGFARHEKGNDLLQEAIKQILAEPGCENLQFVCQWPEPFEMPDGSWLGPDSHLMEDPRMEFLNHSLDADAYEALLARTDLVVLPYRRNSYHHRVSRVAIEAASHGIPLIYTTGTWSGELAELAGGGVGIPEESAEAVARSLRRAIQDLAPLSASAGEGAQAVMDFHSAGHFREMLAGFCDGVNFPISNSQSR